MVPGDGVLSIISSVARRDSVLWAARIFHPLTRCLPILGIAMAIAVLAARGGTAREVGPNTQSGSARRCASSLPFHVEAPTRPRRALR